MDDETLNRARLLERRLAWTGDDKDEAWNLLPDLYDNGEDALADSLVERIWEFETGEMAAGRGGEEEE